MLRAAAASRSVIRTAGRSTQPSFVNSSFRSCGTLTPSVRVVERPATRTFRPKTAVTTHQRMQSLREKPVNGSGRWSTSPTATVQGSSLKRYPGRRHRCSWRSGSPRSALREWNREIGPLETGLIVEWLAARDTLVCPFAPPLRYRLVDTSSGPEDGQLLRAARCASPARS